MGVVDDDAERLALVDRLEAPGTGPAVPMPATTAGIGTPSSTAAVAAARALATLKRPPSGTVNSLAAPGEPARGRREVQVGHVGEGVADRRDLGGVEQEAPVRVVEVHDRPAESAGANSRALASK